MQTLTLLILANLFLSTLYSFVTGRKPTVLLCGLWGFCGKDHVDFAKLKILGMFNISRGRDSCGYYYNGKIVKGINEVKVWDEFLVKNVINEDDEFNGNNVFIGHTRASTVGANTEANAHPFDINGRLILAHNGTLDNIWELCEKYGLNIDDYDVDSQALGALIDTVGVRILNEYRGYAALLVHDISKPNTLHVYHGASKEDTEHGTLWEERPMFYLETKEGIYFSSIENSLKVIRSNAEQVVKQLDHNRWTTIINGKFDKKRIIVDRELNNLGIKKKVVSPKGYHGKNTQNSPSGKTNTKTMQDFINEIPFKKDNNLTGYIENNFDKKNIANETIPLIAFHDNEWDSVYFWKGRYFHGNDELCDGEVFLSKEGDVYDAPNKGVFPHYFYRGIKIINEKVYKQLISDIELQNARGIALTDPKQNFANNISTYSKYPVSNFEDEASLYEGIYKTFFWKGCKLATESITPVFSDRNYTFKGGELKSVTNIRKNSGDIIWTNNAKHITKFANSFVAEINKSAPIEEEVVKNDPKQEDTCANPVYALQKYFYKIYDSVEQVTNEVPITVIEAVSLYIDDMMKDCQSPMNADERVSYTSQFIEACVTDKIAFEDNMAAGYPLPLEYVKMAYGQEITDKEMKKIEDEYADFTVIDTIDAALVDHEEKATLIVDAEGILHGSEDTWELKKK